MPFLRAVAGCVLGAIPGIVLLPVLEFFALALIVGGVIAGAMMGWAPKGRRLATGWGAFLGFLAAGFLVAVPSIGILLAPAAVILGGWYGMKGNGPGSTRPAAQA